MNINFDNLKNLYQQNIDTVIDGIGKNIELHFEETIITDTNAVIDRVHGSHKNPSFKSDGYQETQNTMNIKGLISWNPRDAESYGINISNDRPLVKFKTYLRYAPYLTQATFMVANLESDQITARRFQLLRGPLSRGFKEDRYCITFWEGV